MIKISRTILSISILVFLLSSCAKEQEGFPKFEKDTFTTRFVFKNNRDGGVSNLSMKGFVYYPYEDEYLSQSQSFIEKEWSTDDTAFFEFREPVYSDVKSYMEFTVKFWYQASETEWKEDTATFQTALDVLTYQNQDYVFNWPYDTTNNAVRISD